MLHARISQSSGPLRENVLLDRAALDTLMRCTAAPVALSTGVKWMTLEYVWKLDEAESKPEEVASVTQKAEQGDAQEQLRLSEWLHLGLNLAHDEAKSLTWLRRSAEGGLAEAQYRLGMRVQLAESAHWLQLAADQAHPLATYKLSSRFQFGLGVPKSEQKAFDMLRRAESLGVIAARQDIAMRLHEGRGVEKSDGQALQWMEKAASIGYGSALFDLAKAYAEGWAGQPLPNKALVMYMLAERAGDSRAAPALERLRKAADENQWDAAVGVANEWVPGHPLPPM